MTKHEWTVSDLAVLGNLDRYSALQIGGSRNGLQELLDIMRSLARESQSTQVEIVLASDPNTVCKKILAKNSSAILYKRVKLKKTNTTPTYWQLVLKAPVVEITFGDSECANFTRAIESWFSRGGDFMFFPEIEPREGLHEWRRKNSIFFL